MPERLALLEASNDKEFKEALVTWLIKFDERLDKVERRILIAGVAFFTGSSIIGFMFGLLTSGHLIVKF